MTNARLLPQAELVIYRVLQEALRNVEQHACARHVSVSLSCRASIVQLAIKDDGIGFDPSDPQTARFGLLVMRERASAVGGSLAVKSRVKTGTEVRLRVPWIRRPVASG